ncbi:MAG: hypothetical protein WD825_08390 [Gemmatimonadaceae bacterium]
MLGLRHAAEIFFITSAGLFATSVTFAVLWVRARERAVRAEALLEGRGRGSMVEGLSPAIDAIALEVERIGEGQRYLTQVLSDRPGIHNESKRIATDTPH